MSKHFLLQTFIGLLLSMFIISLAVTIALNLKPIYYSDIDRYDLTSACGLTKEELKQDYDELINYNCIWGDDELKPPHFELSENASKHFADARQLFLFFGWGILVFGGAALGLIYLSPRRQYGYGHLLVASFVTVVLPVVLGILALTSWDKFFVAFHKMFFSNDLWIFDPATDPIIKVLPEQFFLHEALAIFALVIAGGIICLITYFVLRNKDAAEDALKATNAATGDSAANAATADPAATNAATGDSAAGGSTDSGDNAPASDSAD